MKEIYPNYYNKFSCIADRCRHNCCIGWEIDIDEDTMALYNALDTPFGEKIRANIEGEVPHFILKEDNKCPFLNENGLCDIIMRYGEDAICDICYLHPRFKNFYPSFTETGLGLSCEEVARIILTEEEKFFIDTPSETELTKEEISFLEKRQEIFSLLQDRKKDIGQRLSILAEKYGLIFDFSMENLRTKFLSLERLDESWTKELNSIKDFHFDRKIFECKAFQIPFEQLAVYFVFRHLWSGKDNGCIRFLITSCYLIGAICSCNGYTIDKMTDIVRMYSAEVEYAEENTEAVMNWNFSE